MTAQASKDCLFLKDGKCIVLYETDCGKCPIRGASFEALPCPFCGCEACVRQLPDKSRYAGKWAVGCFEDENCLGSYKNVRRLFTERADAVAAWNIRNGAHESSPYPSSVCGRVRWLSRLYGLTITGICQDIQISDATFRHWQSGYSEPHATDIGRLSEILDVTCDFLLTGGKQFDAPYVFPMGAMGERIRMMRMENLLTQYDLEEKIRRSHNTIRRWELGEAYPTASDTVKLSELFRVSCEWLIHGEQRTLLEQERNWRRG